jgi:hypothetical protein
MVNYLCVKEFVWYKCIIWSLLHVYVAFVIGIYSETEEPLY